MSSRCLQLVFLLAILLPMVAPAKARPHNGKKVVAYVPNWIDLAAFADTIDYAKVTHINAAFENPTSDSGDLSFDSKDAILLAKAHKNRIPVLVSIGGGLASSDPILLARYAKLLRESNRAGFVAKLADYVVAHGFDGLDVDLEGPSIDENYGPFIEELAKAMKSKHKLLTAALSQGYGGNKVPDAVLKRFDWVNIMAYDGAGSWAPNAPGQHSSLAFAKSNAAYWLKHGLPRSKAILGVPFYGYGFGKAFRNGVYDYSEIIAAYPGAENADQTGDTIWYNGLTTIRAKAKYVNAQQLGGMMIWSLDTDGKGAQSLLSALYEVLEGKKTPP